MSKIEKILTATAVTGVLTFSGCGDSGAKTTDTTPESKTEIVNKQANQKVKKFKISPEVKRIKNIYDEIKPSDTENKIIEKIVNYVKSTGSKKNIELPKLKKKYEIVSSETIKVLDGLDTKVKKTHIKEFDYKAETVQNIIHYEVKKEQKDCKSGHGCESGVNVSTLNGIFTDAINSLKSENIDIVRFYSKILFRDAKKFNKSHNLYNDARYVHRNISKKMSWEEYKQRYGYSKVKDVISKKYFEDNGYPKVIIELETNEKWPFYPIIIQNNQEEYIYQSTKKQFFTKDIFDNYPNIFDNIRSIPDSYFDAGDATVLAIKNSIVGNKRYYKIGSPSGKTRLWAPFIPKKYFKKPEKKVDPTEKYL